MGEARPGQSQIHYHFEREAGAHEHENIRPLLAYLQPAFSEISLELLPRLRIKSRRGSIHSLNLLPESLCGPFDGSPADLQSLFGQFLAQHIPVADAFPKSLLYPQDLHSPNDWGLPGRGASSPRRIQNPTVFGAMPSSLATALIPQPRIRRAKPP